jgi:putative transposase
MIVSIPPNLSISNFVKKIKGSSNHFWNFSLSVDENKLYWQEGYGIFSLSNKQLNFAIDYVSNQKIHHLEDKIIPALEEENELNNFPKISLIDK